MGEQGSNPVLEAIEHQSNIQQDKKYPKEHLHFNGLGWRAYYHTHSNQNELNHLFENEHGHFHIFVCSDKEADIWGHVVALSMDEFGQPLRWFMVNHWVTGESWLEADTLTQQLNNIPYIKQKNLLEKWMLAMLAVYSSEIKSLLIKRDAGLGSKESEMERLNRNIYLLAEDEINLQHKMEQIFIN